MCCIPWFRLLSGCGRSCASKEPVISLTFGILAKVCFLMNVVLFGLSIIKFFVGLLFVFYILCFCFETGVGRALDAASKERECEDLKLWRPAVINHLYWAAASTPDGDPDVMEAKWKSMVNHVQDIHEHGTPAFLSCAHPPLEGEARNKQWLEPGTAY